MKPTLSSERPMADNDNGEGQNVPVVILLHREDLQNEFCII